jgi:hypothetical protein
MISGRDYEDEVGAISYAADAKGNTVQRIKFNFVIVWTSRNSSLADSSHGAFSGQVEESE